MLHLAAKAFWPAPVPFPVLHVDTGHNFPEVLDYRDRTVARLGPAPRGRLACRTTSTTAGCASAPTAPATRCRPSRCSTRSPTHRFDAVFGGGRRDEEKARAKERIFSLRDEFGQWDPRNQRPELWNLYNGRHRAGEHVRVFPLSNWTELDVWRYIERESIELPGALLRPRARGVRSATACGWPSGRGLQPRERRDRGRPSRCATAPSATCRCTGAVESDAAIRATTSSPRSPRPAHRARRDPRRRPDLRGRHGGPQEGGLLLMSAPTLLASPPPGRSTTASPPSSAGCCTTPSRCSPTSSTPSSGSARDRGLATADLALLTDGLRAEREQGITIDVAYRYFATADRSLHPGRLPRARAVHPQHGDRRLHRRRRRRCSSTPARACSSRPAGTWPWPPCCGCRTSSSP